LLVIQSVQRYFSKGKNQRVLIAKTKKYLHCFCWIRIVIGTLWVGNSSLLSVKVAALYDGASYGETLHLHNHIYLIFQIEQLKLLKNN
jgi:hypothetical protein